MNPHFTGETRFKNILYCTDFSASAEAAYEFAMDATLRRPGARLHLLHIVPESEAQFWKSYLYEVDNVDNQARQDMDAKIASTYLAQAPAGMPVKVVIRPGPEAETILDYAREEAIDLIVMGREGSGGLQQALFGRVAEKIVRKAPCPVLVIPLAYSSKRE